MYFGRSNFYLKLEPRASLIVQDLRPCLAYSLFPLFISTYNPTNTATSYPRVCRDWKKLCAQKGMATEQNNNKQIEKTKS